VTKAIVAKRDHSGQCKFNSSRTTTTAGSKQQPNPEERMDEMNAEEWGLKVDERCERRQSEGKRTDSEIDY